ncbi:hypothetical protein, partial [Listeria booriae]
MGTHKLIQKSLKLTAVGAIAFSVLAQPLSMVASASEVTKTENKLLTATVQSKELLKNNIFTPISYLDTTAEQPFPNWQMALVSSDTSLENISAVGADTKLTYTKMIDDSRISYFTYGSSYPWMRISIFDDGRVTLYGGYADRLLDRVAFYQDVPTTIGKIYTLNQITPTTQMAYSVYASDTSSSTQLAYISAYNSAVVNNSTTFIATSSTTRITTIINGMVGASVKSIQSPNYPISVSLKENSDTTKIKTDIDALFLDNTPTSNAIKTTTDQAAIDALQKQIDILEASTTKTT